VAEELTDRVAVVTGASSGIGAAVARHLSRAGALVVLGARRTDRLAGLVEELRAANASVEAVETDVRDEVSARALVERAAELYGGVDVLVNNAGVMLHSPMERNLSDQWRQMVETNLLGAMYTTGAAIPWFERAGRGDVVNIGSVASYKARPTAGPYAATKFGLRALSESLRQELLDTGVRVILVSPGETDTELPSHITDPGTIALRSAQRPPDRELLEADDIAEAVVWTLTRPRRMSVNELVVRPSRQAN
jgi:clavulanate-9-aldehyde reducatase